MTDHAHVHPCRSIDLEGYHPKNCQRVIPCDHPDCRNDPCGIFCDPCFERESVIRRTHARNDRYRRAG